MPSEIIKIFFSVQVTIGLIFFCALNNSNAIPKPPSCSEQLILETEANQLPIEEYKSEIRKAYAKSYIFANMLFPQFSSGISSALVTHYFTHEISFHDILDTFKKTHEYDLMVKAMNSAHAAHGVKVIDLGELNEIIEMFESRLRYSIRNTFLHFVPNDQKYDGYFIQQLESFYSTDLDLKKSIDLVKLYSLTVQGALRSELAREMSSRYKQDLKKANEHSDSKAKNRTIFKYSQELSMIVVSALEQEHPELRVMEFPKNKPNGLKKTRAYHFWMTISRTGLEQ